MSNIDFLTADESFLSNAKTSFSQGVQQIFYKTFDSRTDKEQLICG